MKNIPALLIAAALISGLCAGCKKEQPSSPAAIKGKAANAKDWSPEVAAPAHDPNDGQDHSGHNH